MVEDIVLLKSSSKIGRLRELRKIIKSENYSIVWSWGSMEATLGLLLTFITNVKHINGSVRHGIVQKKFSHYWRMFILHLSRYIVANSMAGLRANKLKRGFVLYNGIDKGFSAVSDISKKVNGDIALSGHDMITFVSVANLVPYKDYITVLNSMMELKEHGYMFNYLIIGEGAERHNIESHLNRLGLENEVKLLGRQTDIKSILVKSDIFVHSSYGEGCSNAILEAMAVGLPVIASDTGGTSEIVDPEVGRLFSYKK